MPALPQSPVTPTTSFRNDSEEQGNESKRASRISRSAEVDEEDEVTVARPSTSTHRSSTRISRMFTPRRKVTSIISIGSSSSGHGHSMTALGEAREARKKVTSVTSVGNQSAEQDMNAISSSAPSTSPLTSANFTPQTHTPGSLTRKGFEPVGHIAKAPKKSLWRKNPTPDSKRQLTSSFSASTTSLVSRENSAKQKNMRRASVSGGTGWRIFGRSKDNVQSEAWDDAGELSGSGDEIDEIRRPSDLGPAAEVMAPEQDEKSLPDIPVDIQEELNRKFPYAPSPLPSPTPTREKEQQVLTNPTLLSHILNFLPTPDVCRVAIVSRLWSGSARVALYGCLDLRLRTAEISNISPIASGQRGRGRSDTVTANHDPEEEYGDACLPQDEEATRRRRKLRRRLELIIDTLRVRNGELFEGTWGLLMDEWPSGWDSLVTGWQSEPTVDVTDDDNETLEDAESVHTEYTGYSESDFTHSVSDLGHSMSDLRKASTPSLLLDIPHAKKDRDRSPSPVYHLNLSDSPPNSPVVSAPNVPSNSPRKMRTHPKTLMTTLLASLPSLTTLCLPTFVFPILRHHTAFGLSKIEFLSEEKGERETEEMLGWLDGMVGVRELRIGSQEWSTTVDEGEEDSTTDDGGLPIPAKNSLPPDIYEDNLGRTASSSTATTKRKRKTLLIISPPAGLSVSAPSTGIHKPMPSPTFPGTSFPMPPSTPLSERRSSTLDTPGSGSSLTADRPTPLKRPSSLLVPNVSNSSDSTQPISLPSSPMPLQTQFSISIKTQDVRISTALNSSPTTSTSSPSAQHTPTVAPTTPITPHTPMSPITPFTPAFYLHSISTSSLPLTPSLVPSFSSGSGIRELCLKDTLLPELRVFHGPSRLVRLLVPSRRKTIREVRVNVRGTIVSGDLKIGDVIQGLALNEKYGDEDALEKVGFFFQKDTDRRTVEKLLGAVGPIISSRTNEKEPAEEDIGKPNRPKGIHTLEIIFAPQFHMHPNVRKSDEITYKMIHTVLPRYNGLQALQIRRGVLRLDEEQLELHPEVVQTPLPTPVAPDRLAVTAELGPEEQISIDGRSIEIKVDASRNNAPSLPHDAQTPDDPTPPIAPFENSIAFPTLSPPASPLAPSMISTISLEKQKLRDRKMRRRLGSSTQGENSLDSSSLAAPDQTADSLSVRSVSHDGQGSPRPSYLSFSSDRADENADRMTLQSSSTRSHRRGLRSVRSISSISSLASFGSFSLATTTRAVVQVVNATKAKAMVFRPGGDIVTNDVTGNANSTSALPDRSTVASRATMEPVAPQIPEEAAQKADECHQSQRDQSPQMQCEKIVELVNNALTSSQRRYIRLWTRMCPSLKRVVFLNGGTWVKSS
ncbi:hypothetical protein VNI00_008971 [Paramarasmius palmivorus]|uniref:F-box domain-containing protein n=1 Tax=Paramarasmius palmivorus TaxID=297713 RepID=A0AAW0CPC3_9AGAR